MDVVGLYNHIPHADGLMACRTVLDQRPTKDPPTEDLVILAKLILTLNAFQFEDRFYLQKHGTAMGTRMALSYAKFFMGDLKVRSCQLPQKGKSQAFVEDSSTIFLEYGFTENKLYSDFSAMPTIATP